jgi:hypothetical protein
MVIYCRQLNTVVPKLAKLTSNLMHIYIYDLSVKVKVKVKQSRYTPWRRLGGEEV